MQANQDIQEKIHGLNLLKWEIAEQAGIADTTLSKWLRTPLNDERRKRVEKAIAELTHSVKQ